MAGVDNRIVTMQFNNRDFEQNARTSMTTLQKLKEQMNFGTIVGGTVRALGTIQSALSKLGLSTPFAPFITAANKGLNGVGAVLDRLGMRNPFVRASEGANELQKAAQNAGGPAGMGALEGGVTAVSNKFIALSTIAITALSNITNRAINAGTNLVKSLSIEPVMQGFREYETNLSSIQTIMANTGLEGQKGLDKVNKALGDLNTYSDKTIYNFSEMARNIGTFTAAGVDLDTATSAIKGIANLAAVSGSTSQQASSAMYQLSQALAAGKVGLQDWNSVVNAGMGGKVFQDALIKTAVHIGALNKEAVKTEGPMKKMMINGQSFRDSIMAKPGEQSWLTSDVLTKTLNQLSGDLTRADLAAQGYSKAQQDAILKQARMAQDAATKVKTLTQLMDTLKEAVGSGWTQSFQLILGDFGQAKTLFTGVSNYLGKLIGDQADARNKLLKQWQKAGGRDTLIEGLRNAWTAFHEVLKAVGAGFRDIFPKKTPGGLVAMTKSFADFMKALVPSEETLEKIRAIAGGVFAVFGIGKQILGGVITAFKTMFESVGGGNGDFLEFFATIGQNLVQFNNFLKESGLITAFFEGLGKILSVPLALLKGVGEVITGIFGGFDSEKASQVGETVDKVGKRLSGLQGVAERVKNWIVNIGELFGNLGSKIGEALAGIGDKVASMFTADTFGATLDVINTTLLGGIVLLIKNFFQQGVSVDLTGGLFDGIKETLGSATDAFGAMQAKLKADLILKIAIAIGAMAAALLVLSMIDPSALKTALAAMAGGFGILIAAMATLMKVLGPVGLAQMYVVTSAVTKMSFSILLLSIALKKMSEIEFADMLRGLLGMSLALKVMSKALLPLAAGSKGMAKASFSLILLGVALNIMAVALKIFATMSWEEMAKGLAGLTGTLIALAVGLKLMPPMQAEAIALLALGVAINAIAVALKLFATISWEEMGRGLAALAGSLAIISLAVRSMPKTMILQSVALVAVAGSLVILAGALKIMGSMGWEAIAKGLIVLGGAMLILAVGLNAIGIIGTIGAIGLTAAAKALLIFTPVMLALGAMKWESILKALAALAGIFVVLGVAGYALAPVVPVIFALAASLLLIGAGLALMGAGALAAATAFGIVVAAGSAGIQILMALVASVIAAIPPALAAFGKGIVQFAVAIGQGAPAIALAFGQVLNNLLTQAIKAVPRMGTLFLRLITTAARVVSQAAPRLFAAGIALIMGFLRAIDKNIGGIVNTVSSIISKFLSALGRNSGKIIQGAVDMILGFMRGIAKAIRDNGKKFGEAGADIGIAIVEGTLEGIKGAGGKIVDALGNLAKKALDKAKDFLGIGGPSKLFEKEVGVGIPLGIASGIDKDARHVVRSIDDLGNTATRTARAAMAGVSDALTVDPNMSPTVTPVLDLTSLTREANKMSSILAVSPIQASVSYQTAADISELTAPPADNGEGGDDGTGRGDQYNELNLHLHSPKPIDSVEAYRGGKTLIGLAKEALK